MKKKKQAKVAKEGSVWSFPFFLATLGNLLLALLSFSLLLTSLPRHLLLHEIGLSFSVGLTTAVLVALTTKMTKLRVWVHEFKHAAAVVLTGNKLDSFVVKDDTGYIEYRMYEGKTSFAPIITIAPYFLPIFSVPIFCFCIALESYFPIPLCLLLGFALGADVCLGFGEIHPSQTDFSSMFGGFLLTKLYLVGFYLFWPTLLIAWVRSGNEQLVGGLVRLGLMLSYGFVS